MTTVQRQKARAPAVPIAARSQAGAAAAQTTRPSRSRGCFSHGPNRRVRKVLVMSMWQAATACEVRAPAESRRCARHDAARASRRGILPAPDDTYGMSGTTKSDAFDGSSTLAGWRRKRARSATSAAWSSNCHDGRHSWARRLVVSRVGVDVKRGRRRRSPPSHRAFFALFSVPEHRRFNSTLTRLVEKRARREVWEPRLEENNPDTLAQALAIGDGVRPGWAAGSLAPPASGGPLPWQGAPPLQ